MNNQNSHIYTTKYEGVFKRDGLYTVILEHNRQTHNLGKFKSIDEAMMIRQMVVEKMATDTNFIHMPDDDAYKYLNNYCNTSGVECFFNCSNKVE